MSRRRYLSTEISTDTAINRLARTAGDFAVMLYTWMIPHADDDGIVRGDAEEIILKVIPGRRDKKIEDVTAALAAMQELDLIEWDENARCVIFPYSSFYKYQTYIKPERRRGAEQNNAPEMPQESENSADQRKTPQNVASLKHSLSHPVKHSHSEKEQPTVASPPTPQQVAHRAMFGALARAFGKPTPGTEHKKYEAAAKELVTAGADPAEIPHLCEAWGWINTVPPRVNSLAGNLTVLRKAKPRPASNGKNGHAPIPASEATVVEAYWADVRYETTRWLPGAREPTFVQPVMDALASLGGWAAFVRDGAQREAFVGALEGVTV